MNRKERRAATKQGGGAPSPAGGGPQRIYDEALRLHTAGRRGDAERLFRQIPAGSPLHGHSLHFLADIARLSRQPDKALELAARAIAIDGGIAAYHYNLANILRDLGRTEDAVASYRRALVLAPAYPEASNNLGLVLQGLGRIDGAEENYRRALQTRPDFPEAMSNLGNVLRERNQLGEAVGWYTKALSLKPGYPEAQYNLGIALKGLGRNDEAIAAYRRAIALRPNFVEAYNNLGIALKDQGQLDEALACYSKALEISSRAPETHSNMGNALRELGREEEAMGAFNRALSLAPGDAEAHSNMGNALRDLGRADDAVASYRKALTLKPDMPEAFSNLGVVLQDMGRMEEAVDAYEAALAAAPDNAGFHWNLSLGLLVMGDFARGWPEYEWRVKTEQHPKPVFSKPAWDGGDLTGQTLLLYEEQGAGDSIQFVRYARLAKARGADIVLACRPELAKLLATAPGVDRLSLKGETLPAFDCHASLLSLPLLFKTEMETIPGDTPYLSTDAAAAEGWRTRLPATGRNIGVVWRGNPIHKNDRRRSIPAATFAELVCLDTVNWLSLQKDGRPDELAALNAGGTVRDLGPEMGDWADTAALVSQLDLVITVDTAVAHVAGAIGKPVWLLIPFSPDWRWLLHRADSPWYPTARIFRQHEAGDWNGVFADVRAALETFMPP
jgi:tetratricopeptide (TPR) repeat protein